MMTASSIGSITFDLTATIFGVPISGTHTMIGGVCGGGMAGLGPRALDYGMLFKKVVPSWFLSPAIAGSLCFTMIVIVSLATLNGAKARLSWRLFNLQCITGAVLALDTWFLLILIQKNGTPKGQKIVKPWQYVFLPIFFIVGFIASRVWMARIALTKKTLSEKFGFVAKLVTF
jgi:phosphate/sulfate permease